MEVQSCTAIVEVSTVISQKVGNQASTRPCYSVLGHILKGSSIILQRYLLTYVHSSFILIARTWKQLRCPLTKEWIKKMWYIYTMECYLPVKNKDTRTFEDKWMELEKKSF